MKTASRTKAPAPLESVCWHGLSPSNSYVFGWSCAHPNRDRATTVDARMEFFRNGDSAVTLDDETTRFRRVLPFDHDGVETGRLRNAGDERGFQNNERSRIDMNIHINTYFA